MLLNIFYIVIGLLALSFCIFIHELGHFMAAKRRGLIADRFSIGFGPRLFGWKWKGTDFRISLLPLGGYVSLPQLADMGRLEGGEEEEADDLPPISYADKMIVAVMGAVFNVILAFCLSLIVWGMGRDIVNTTEVGNVAKEIRTSDGEIVPGPAYEAGIQVGDRILAVNGDKVSDWNQYQTLIALSVGRTEDKRPVVDLSISREGHDIQVTAYPAIVSSENMRYLGLAPPTIEGITGPIVVALEKNMPAYAAGLQAGDQLVALDGEPIISSEFLSSFLSNHGDKVINVSIIRDDQEALIQIKPRIKTEAGEVSPRFGFQYDYPYLTTRVHQNPMVQLGNMADTMRRTLIALVSSKSDVKVRNMQAPIGIVHTLSRGARDGVITLIWILALINVNLAIFNVLPIPVLDGGHMLFATIAKITGRPLPRKVIEASYTACIIMLLTFVIYVSFFDVKRVGQDMGIGQNNEAETVQAEETGGTSNVEPPTSNVEPESTQPE